MFLASPKPAAQRALKQLTDRYGQSDLTEADCVVPIGGDGVALNALHTVLSGPSKPVFAMRHEGSVGFLANAFQVDDLPKRIQAATSIQLSPLRAESTDITGQVRTAFGINEITLVRQTRQSAKLHLTVNGIERPRAVIGDGILVATPVGSTAYNRSAGGPSLPLSSRLLALTGLALSPASGWAHAVLDEDAVIEIEVIDPSHRPVRLETDIHEESAVQRVRIAKSEEHNLTLLFDPEAHLHERNLQARLDPASAYVAR
jgi:NAD+ kinase